MQFITLSLHYCHEEVEFQMLMSYLILLLALLISYSYIENLV